MFGGKVSFPGGLDLRPSRASDKAFIKTLHDSTRDDLRLIQGDPEFVQTIIDMQYKAQTEGYGETYPNAMEMVIEKNAERIGLLLLDFGHNEVRVVNLAFIPAARGKGYGTVVLTSLQRVCAQVKAPLALTVLRTNLGARKLYATLGFQSDAEISTPTHERLIWYPTAAAMAG